MSQMEPVPEPDDLSERWADLSVGDDEHVIYDRENHRAWIQSTIAADATDMT